MNSAHFRSLLVGALLVATPVLAAFPESHSMMVRWKGGQLEYTVSLKKSTFFKYEPVLVEIWAKNNSRRTVTVVTHTTRPEGWILRDQTGKQYRQRRGYDTFSVEKKIKPGDFFGGVVDLNTFGVSDSNTSYPYPLLPVGEYTVSYRVDGNSTVPMRFSVVEPTGEEARAVELFLDAYKPTRGGAYTRANDVERDNRYAESTKRLIAFADSFQGSVYAAEALAEAGRNAWNILGEGDLAYRLNMRMIKEYGDPFMSGIDFFDLYYLDTKRDTVGFRSELDSLIRLSDNPKLAQVARRKLRKLKEKPRNREKMVPTGPFLED